MTYTIRWITEPRCALVTLTDKIEGAEVEALMAEITTILEQYPTTFHMILDTSNRPNLQFNVFKIPSVLKVAGHERFGWLSSVAPTSLVSFWMEGLHRMFGMRFKVFASIEDAQQFVDGMMRLEQTASSGGQTELPPA